MRWMNLMHVNVCMFENGSSSGISSVPLAIGLQYGHHTILQSVLFPHIIAYFYSYVCTD